MLRRHNSVLLTVMSQRYAAAVHVPRFPIGLAGEKSSCPHSMRYRNSLQVAVFCFFPYGLFVLFCVWDMGCMCVFCARPPQLKACCRARPWLLLPPLFFTETPGFLFHFSTPFLSFPFLSLLGAFFLVSVAFILFCFWFLFSPRICFSECFRSVFLGYIYLVDNDHRRIPRRSVNVR